MQLPSLRLVVHGPVSSTMKARQCDAETSDRQTFTLLGSDSRKSSLPCACLACSLTIEMGAGLPDYTSLTSRNLHSRCENQKPHVNNPAGLPGGARRASHCIGSG
jgi:hypothetical protein